MSIIDLNNQESVFVLHISSDDAFGGAEAQLCLILNNVLSDKLAVLCLSEGPVFEHAGVKQIPRFAISENLGIYSLFKKSIFLVRNLSPRIIVSHGYKEAFLACLCSRLTTCSWIHVFHGVGERHFGLQAWKIAIYKIIERILCKFFAHKLVFVSEDTRRELRFSNCSKGVVIHNAANIPSQAYKKTPVIETELYVDGERQNILWIGRLVQVKRPDLAILAFKELTSRGQTSITYDSKLPNLHVIGDGPLMSSLVNTTTELGIKELVFFHGFQNSLDPWYRKASMILICSDSEGLPTVLLEASHYGIPVVSTSVGGIPEFKSKIPSYPLLLSSTGSVEDLAALIEKSLLNNKFGERAPIQAIDTSYFGPRRLLAEYHALYEEILKSRI